MSAIPPGYQQTNVGVIPEEWDVHPLQSCLATPPDYGINAPAVPFSDKLPTYIRITDIAEDGKFSKESHIIEFKETWRDDCLRWRGMQRILDACNAAGTPKPKVTYDPSDLWFEFPFAPEYLRLIAAPAEPIGSSEKTSEGLVGGLVDGLVESQQLIIKLIRQKPAVSKREMAEHIGISTTAVDKNIDSLKAKGWLKRIGPDKGGHWEVRP